MTDKHLITPPPELVENWRSQAPAQFGLPRETFLATQAAQWGADRELDECCHLLRLHGFDVVDDLRATRRPKPPSLKAQALEQLDGIATCFRATHMGDIVCDKIRRALETLDD